MQIQTGKKQAPVRAVIYGPEGIGKTTIASKFPNPLFIDVEKGTSRFDVARVEPSNYLEIKNFIQSVSGFDTIVFDTADWMEKLIIQYVLASVPHEKGGFVTSIEGYNFGKGYVHLAEEWKRFLDLASSTGKNIVFLAHSQIKRVEPPHEAGYDRFEMKLGSKSTPLLKEWADIVLFCNFETMVVEVNGKPKAQGGRRTMYADHSPAWDAKNRFGLPAQMDMDFGKISSIFHKIEPKQPSTESAKTESKPADADVPPELKPAEQQAPQTAQPKADQLFDQIKELMKGSGISAADLVGYLRGKGVIAEGQKVSECNDVTKKRIIANWKQIETETKTK